MSTLDVAQDLEAITALGPGATAATAAGLAAEAAASPTLMRRLKRLGDTLLSIARNRFVEAGLGVLSVFLVISDVVLDIVLIGELVNGERHARASFDCAPSCSSLAARAGLC